MKISDLTPEDQIKESMTILNDSLASELLDAILNNEPAFFEKLVVDLLLKMGMVVLKMLEPLHKYLMIEVYLV